MEGKASRSISRTGNANYCNAVSSFFEDCMLKGAFKSICHKHYFEQQNEITFMKDIFNYEVPYGIAGILFNSFYLKKYMTRLLVLRNQCIKDYAETGKWKTLPGM